MRRMRRTCSGDLKRETIPQPRDTAIITNCSPIRMSSLSLSPHRTTGTKRWCWTPWPPERPFIVKRTDDVRRVRETDAGSGQEEQYSISTGPPGRQHASTAEAGRRILHGDIGPVTLIHVGRYFNGTKERPLAVVRLLQCIRPARSGAGYQGPDWETWLGPAPKIDFNEKHFWHWRCYWPYGTGQAGDLLSHEMDHVQSVLGWGIPDSCTCAGFNAYYNDGRETPDTWLASYVFEKQSCSLTFEGCMNSAREQAPEYIGKKGRIFFNAIGQDANRFYQYPDSPAFPHMGKEVKPNYVFDPADGPAWPTHMEDFLQCVRTGERPKCNIDEAFIEVVTLLMSVQAYHQKRQVRWDPVAEAIV